MSLDDAAELAEIERARRARLSDPDFPARAALSEPVTSALAGLARAPIQHRLTETIVALPPA